MKETKHITHYFQTAQLMAEPMSLKEVHSLIESNGNTSFSKLLNFKTVLMMTTLIAIIFILFNSDSTTVESRVNETEIPQMSEQTRSISSELEENAEEFFLITNEPSAESPSEMIERFEPISMDNILLAVDSPVMQMAELKQPELSVTDFNWIDEIKFTIPKQPSKDDLKRIEEEIRVISNGLVTFSYRYLFGGAKHLDYAIFNLTKTDKDGNVTIEFDFNARLSEFQIELGWVMNGDQFVRFYYAQNQFLSANEKWNCPRSPENNLKLDSAVQVQDLTVVPGEYSVTFMPSDDQEERDAKMAQAQKNGLDVNYYHPDYKPKWNIIGINSHSKVRWGAGWRIKSQKDAVTVEWEVTPDLKVHRATIKTGKTTKVWGIKNLVSGPFENKCNCGG